MFNNDDFYPTPESLAHRMFAKVNFSKVNKMLEPSAGKGDLIKALETYKYKSTVNERFFSLRDFRFEIDAIEIQTDLHPILNDMERVAVVDNDFLSYPGSTHYDLIIANFPFSEGEKHLHKALDVIFCGQIVCLINAETLKNPCTKSRQDLVTRLKKLNADIEYIQNTFTDAERKTDVEIALVYVNIERSVEIDVFGEMADEDPVQLDCLEEQNEVSTKDTYHDLVAKYNQSCEQVSSQLIAFYKNHKNIAKYLDLQIIDDKGYYRDSNSLTDLMRKKQNNFIKRIKKEYWEKVTDLPEVKKYLTSKERDKLSANNEVFYLKEFSIANIQQFVLNLVKAYPEHITNAIGDLFETMTSYALKDKSYGFEEYKNNIHYFNAWKTNSGYKINKKVILPFYRDYSFDDWNKLGMRQAKFLNDIEKVMHYFNPSRHCLALNATEDCPRSLTIDEICDQSLKSGENRKIETAYFHVSIFKKGTIHLEFKDEDLLRRFNIEACKLKNFIPKEYSDKEYADLNDEEREIVNQFEGEAAYKPVRENVRLFGSSNILALEHQLN